MRIATPSNLSKRPPEAVHHKGRTPTNVRSTSKSDVKADILEPPLSATWRPEQLQHKLRLLDHLVGAAEQRKRARNPKRLGSFEVKYQLDVDGLLDRQISRFVTFEAELLGVVAPVCQMPRRRGGIIRPPLTRAYSRERRFCAERCRCDCVNCIAGP